MQLEERITKAIEKYNFNFIELEGFKSNPHLALKAGAAIGYKLGLDELNIWLTDHPIKEKEEEKWPMI